MRGRSLATLALLVAPAAWGKPAPEFTLPSLDGHAVHLADFRGKVVLLNFWATWCAGCRVEMPRLVEQHRRHHSQGLEIVGVSMDDAGDALVARFVKEQHINYPIVRGNDAVANAYGGVRYLPQTFVIDRNGALVKSFAGPPDERELEELLHRLLGARHAESMQFPRLVNIQTCIYTMLYILRSQMRLAPSRSEATSPLRVYEEEANS